MLGERSNDEGSVLVESIAILALIALVAMGIIAIASVFQTRTSLWHAATIAARAGAISGETAARQRISRLVGPVNQHFTRINNGGICVFEVRLTKTVHSFLGDKEIHGVGHAVCEE